MNKRTEEDKLDTHKSSPFKEQNKKNKKKGKFPYFYSPPIFFLPLLLQSHIFFDKKKRKRNKITSYKGLVLWPRSFEYERFPPLFSFLPLIKKKRKRKEGTIRIDEWDERH